MATILHTFRRSLRVRPHPMVSLELGSSGAARRHRTVRTERRANIFGEKFGKVSLEETEGTKQEREREREGATPTPT